MSIEDIFRALQAQAERDSDPNREPEPEIARDRLVSPGPLHMCVVFKRCQHHHHIPSYIFDEMKDNRECIEFINQLKCPDCIREWAEMENSLNREYQQFIRNGGKL